MIAICCTSICLALWNIVELTAETRVRRREVDYEAQVIGYVESKVRVFSVMTVAFT